MKNYKELQNGSDIRGVALDTGDKRVNLSVEAAIDLTKGFLKYLSQKSGKEIMDLKVAIGGDSRVTTPELVEAAAKLMSKCGVEVLDCGMASTPAMFMTTIYDETKCDGAIMVTASHLPYERNGFKYFDKDGGLNKEDIREIIDFGEKDIDIKAEAGQIVKFDLIELYSKKLREKIIKEVGREDALSGLKVVVDCGNGAGGFYATKVIEPLGGDIAGSLFLEPDGMFPNHPSNPEDETAMGFLKEAVLKEKADLGLIFDADVDRVAAVDRNGRELNRNAIVALAAALIAVEHPGTTIVTDSITSDYLKDYLESCLGLKHLRYKRGYKNVINKAIELNKMGTDCQLAIETSGHGAYKENYFLDDGAYLATKILIKEAKMLKAGASIEDMIAPLKEPKEAEELRFEIKDPDFKAFGDRVIAEIETLAKSEEGKKLGLEIVTPNFEGIRVNFKNEDGEGWFLLRKSLHDPVLPLNIEANVGSYDGVLDRIKNLFLRMA